MCRNSEPSCPCVCNVAVPGLHNWFDSFIGIDVVSLWVSSVGIKILYAWHAFCMSYAVFVFGAQLQVRRSNLKFQSISACTSVGTMFPCHAVGTRCPLLVTDSCHVSLRRFRISAISFHRPAALSFQGDVSEGRSSPFWGRAIFIGICILSLNHGGG